MDYLIKILYFNYNTVRSLYLSIRLNIYYLNNTRMKGLAMMKFTLNEGQQNCLNKLIKWWNSYDGSQQVFEIIGEAGTGKTSVIHALIENLESLKIDNVLFVAFIGKAAMQMTKSGVRASTIHSAIYNAVEKVKKDKDGNVILKEGRPVTEIKFVKKVTLDPDIKLIVVDEAAMVDKKVARDLKDYGLPIIALGDTRQLPPIYGDSAFLQHPDFELTEIMRQKADSPIIKLAHSINTAKDLRLEPAAYGDKVLIIKKKDFLDLYSKVLLQADVVICGKNSTRDELNRYIRELNFKEKGIPIDNIPEIAVGDKIICRKNNWLLAVDDINLINGLIGTVESMDLESKTLNFLKIDFKPDFLTTPFEDVKINLKYFFGSKMEKEYIKNSPHDGELFEFGYTITCHLAQGSQYEKVIVFCERLGDNAYYRRWLYTAITRASDKLILVI